ncbi:hypothetical protein [Cellulosilyticum sp. WCF-2]|uniref:hypothetical protein n=1 Tax=Cellulosilyticum sp. WCF-2 TaxID=2497860 RepID=UPI0016815451|nr:hypothetical protein [Cellulosilyticum sp. WCF-2]
MFTRISKFIKEVNIDFRTKNLSQGMCGYVNDEDLKYLLEKIEKRNKDKKELKDFCYK